jgi:hypothetical protein
MGSELDEAQSWILTRGTSVTAMALAGEAAEASASQTARAIQPRTQAGQSATDDISPEVRDFINASQARRVRLEEERRRTEAKQLADAQAIAEANRRIVMRTNAVP